MSLKRSEEIRCPRCGTEQQLTIWLYLNTADNPELRSRVMSGEIFDMTCSKCGYVSRIGYPLLYQDPDKKLVVGLMAERSQEQTEVLLQRLQSADLLGPRRRGYTIRAVMQPPDLAEKVLIAENGLDDRVIEIYKLMIRHTYEKDHGGETPDKLLLLGGDKLRFILFGDDPQRMYFSDFQPETYQDLDRSFSPFFPKEAAENLFIDAQWAQQVLTPSDVVN